MKSNSMTIKELYTKLSDLDNAHAETLGVLLSEQQKVTSDIAGFYAYIDHVIRTRLSEPPSVVAKELDEIFEAGGIVPLPSLYVAETKADNSRNRFEQAEILSTYQVDTLAQLKGKHARLDRDIKGDEFSMQADKNALEEARIPIELILAFNEKHKAQLKPGELGTFGLRDNFRWWTDSTFREARTALARSRGFEKHYPIWLERKAVCDENDRVKTARDTYKKAMAQDISRYHNLSEKYVSDVQLKETLFKEIRRNLSTQKFIDAFFASVRHYAPDFLENLVKLRALEQLAVFIEGKVNALLKQRRALSPALRSLSSVVSRHGDKTAKEAPKAMILDKAIAGSRVDGAYAARNVRNLRKDTVTYSPASSSSSNSWFWSWYWYQMYLQNLNSHTDPGFAAKVCGHPEQQTSGYVAPAADYSDTVRDLTQSGGLQNVSLDSLGIDANTLSNITASFDAGFVVQSIQGAVNAAQDASASVSSSGFSYSSDTGGGYSGGGDSSGGGGDCSAAFNDDAIFRRSFKPMPMALMPKATARRETLHAA